MRPLSKKLRTRILGVLTILFVIATPILIGYSMGYRLDDALGLIQTGGIYLHSNISNTSVYLDDEFVEHNGAFLKNTLIQDLLPNRYYSIRVTHKEYQDWVKVLYVNPNLVTEARVLMLPKEFVWRIITASTTIPVEDKLSSTTTETVTQEVPNPEYEQLNEYFLEDREQFAVDVATSTYEYIRGIRHPTTTTVTEIRFPDWMKEIANTSILIEKNMVREREGVITWLENGDVFAVWGREDEQEPYFFCADICKEQLSINWAEPILRYEFYPNRNDVLLILSQRGLYAVELDNRSQRNIQTIIEKPGLDFRLRPDGSLVVFDGTTYQETTW